MTPGGSAQTRLTGAPQYEPDYSPDGRQMVFMEYRYRGGFYRPQVYRSTGLQVYRSRADGSGLTRLTDAEDVVQPAPPPGRPKAVAWCSTGTPGSTPTSTSTS
jgi:hypothetical protein